METTKQQEKSFPFPAVVSKTNLSTETLKANESHDEEKQALLEMLDKNQKLLQKAQSEYLKEKEEIEQNFQKSQNTLKRQIEIYEQEIEILKTEIDRLKNAKSKQSEESLRNQLLKEIENIRLVENERKSAQQVKISELNQKIEILTRQIEEKNKRHIEEKEHLLRQVDNTRKDARRVENEFQAQLDLLISRFEKTNIQLNKKSQKIEKIQKEYEERFRELLKQKNEEEELWIREKNSLHNEISVKSAEDNHDELMWKQLKEFQVERENVEEAHNERINALEIKKEQLEAQIEQLITISGDRELSLEEEVERLRNANQTLMDINYEREQIFENELENMRKELVYIRESSESQVTQYLKDHSEQNKEYEMYEKVLEEAKNFHAVNLEKEFRIISAQLRQKEAEIKTLKETNRGKPKGRKNNSAVSIMNELLNQQNLINTELENFKIHFKAIEEQSEKKEKENFELIEMLTSQLYSTEQKLVESISQDNEKDYQKLSDRLIVAEQELDYAKKHLEQYISSVKSLEEIIENKNGNDSSDMYKKAQIEISRLNKENQTLLEVKEATDERHLQEKNQLLELIVAKDNEIEKLKSIIKKRKSSKNMMIDEKNRHTTFQNLFKSLEALSKNYSQQLNSIKKVKLQDSSEENKSGKIENKEIKDEFIKENEELYQEIQRLKLIIDSVLDECCKKSSILDEERELLKLEREKMQTLISHSGYKDYFSPKKEKDEKNQSQLITLAKDDIAALQKQLEQERKMHQIELETFHKNNENELLVLRSEQEAFVKHIKILREQLKNINFTSAIQRDAQEKLIKQLKSELSSVKELTNEKIQLLMKEQKKLRTELSQIIEKNSLKDKKRKKSYLEKIKQLESTIDEKNKIIQEKTTHLIQEQARASKIEEEIQNQFKDEIKRLKDEIKKIKISEENKEWTLAREREIYNGALKKLQVGVEAIQQSAISEAHEINCDLEIVNKKIEIYEKEKEILKEQRNEALEYLMRAKIMGEAEKQEILMLVEHLRSQEIKRNKLTM
ncbi:unnamed protein product [Blepharisma stoltei]|uniref:Uncharacterized protein n=1 Tax=Blepharisma stoltei TaxID=1481888 RepID=A0AAU9JJ19_9CILI|nr:unnamed protein product [Blepharisma stoltei]